MKKLLLIGIILTLSCMGLFAQLRTYTQKVVLSDGTDPVITNTDNNSTAPTYIIEAYLADEAGVNLGFSLSTDPTSPNYSVPANIRLKQFSSTNLNKVTQVNILAFNANPVTTWYNGKRVYVRATYIGGTTPEVGEWWYSVIPATTNWNVLTPPVVIPPTIAAGFNLNVTSTPAGATIWKDGVNTNEVTPHTFFPGEAGTYTLGAMAGYTAWTPTEYVVPALTVETTIDFQATLIPDTYLYKLYVNGPDGKAVTGPVPGTTDYIAQNADQSLLLGAYTIGAPDAGYQWTNPTITVDNTGWTLVPPLKGMGARSNGAKVLLTYEKTIEFVQTLIPTTFTLNVTGPDGYAVSGPVAGVTDYVATDSDDMINELTGDYTIAAPPAGYTWAAQTITVSEVNFVANVATIEFVLNEIPPVVTPADPAGFPAGYPSTNYVNNAFVVTGVGVHNLFIPRMPTDTGAMAYYNGMWNLPDGTPDWTWLNVNLSAKAPVQVIVFGPTLPVELSSFSAILTAQNFVKLTWVTESETNMNGYNVYRNETADYAAATHIGYQASTNSSTQHVYTHTDNEVETNNTYYYWLECVDFNGTSTLYGPQYVTVVGNDTPNLPTVTTLNNAYPNPFKSSTTIAVDVKEGENATVTIYNILGQAVMTYRVPAGTHNLNWNGRDSKGNACGSGIYFYKLTSPTKNQTKKMVIVK